MAVPCSVGCWLHGCKSSWHSAECRGLQSQPSKGKGSKHRNSSVLQGEVSQGLDLAFPGHAQPLSISWASNTLWHSRCPGGQSGHRESAQQRGPTAQAPMPTWTPAQSYLLAWVGLSWRKVSARICTIHTRAPHSALQIRDI